jgi:ABC-2 type transport system permease protein
MSGQKQRLIQIVRLAAKEWRLLLRNPHGLAVLFVMPALFLLVMSFTLKNTLVESVDMPITGWVLEDTSPVALQWMREWMAPWRCAFTSAAVQAALKTGRRPA